MILILTSNSPGPGVGIGASSTTRLACCSLIHAACWLILCVGMVSRFCVNGADFVLSLKILVT